MLSRAWIAFPCHTQDSMSPGPTANGSEVPEAKVAWLYMKPKSMVNNTSSKSVPFFCLDAPKGSMAGRKYK